LEDIQSGGKLLIRKLLFLKNRLVKNRGKRLIPESGYLFLMALPFILFVILFHYIPLAGWSIAFFRYSPGLPIFEARFMGLHYFERIFSFGSDFFNVMKNTLGMSFLQILTSPTPMIFAILLAEIRILWLRKTIQIGTTLPHFISFVIVFSIFMSMFSYDDGFVNIFLKNAGVIEKGINPMAIREITWIFQAVIINLWKNLGWSSIVYIAALSGIPPELYEAAELDGASRFRQILHITIPSLMPTYIVLLILGIGNLLSGTNFQQIFVFYNPIVSKTIETLDFYIYRIGIVEFNFSQSTAIGIFRSSVSITLLFTVNAIGKKILGRNVI